MWGKKKAWIVCKIKFAKPHNKHFSLPIDAGFILLSQPLKALGQQGDFEHGGVPPSSSQHHCCFRSQGSPSQCTLTPAMLETLGVRLL